MKKTKENKKDIFSVEGKIIAIIGATGTLGLQYVNYLSSLGARIIMGDVNLGHCRKISDELNSKGLVTYPVEIDIYDECSITSFFEHIKEKHGRLDVLINNAMVKPKGFYASFENYSKETLEKVLNGNLIGVTLACRESVKIFSNQEKGIIINIASIYGIIAADQRLYEGVENIYYPDEEFSSPVSYSISKAGVVQLTKYLASYYRERNIRVNCLTPGGVYDNHDKTFEKNYAYRTTVGRMAKKDEYNGAILFLCTEASNYMSGGNLIVDGGWSIT